MVACANRALYTGITNDLPGRILAHNAGRGGRYTRAFGPVRLMWKARCADRGSASRREFRIKQMTRSQKLALIRRR